MHLPPVEFFFLVEVKKQTPTKQKRWNAGVAFCRASTCLFPLRVGCWWWVIKESEGGLHP